MLAENKNLMAELEELNKNINYTSIKLRDFEENVDRVEAVKKSSEISLKQTCSENEKLKTENEQLKAELDDAEADIEHSKETIKKIEINKEIIFIDISNQQTRCLICLAQSTGPLHISRTVQIFKHDVVF